AGMVAAERVGEQLRDELAPAAGPDLVVVELDRAKWASCVHEGPPSDLRSEKRVQARRRAPAQRREHEVREVSVGLAGQRVARADAESDHDGLQLVEDLVVEEALGIDRQ